MELSGAVILSAIILSQAALFAVFFVLSFRMSREISSLTSSFSRLREVTVERLSEQIISFESEMEGRLSTLDSTLSELRGRMEEYKVLKPWEQEPQTGITPEGFPPLNLNERIAFGEIGEY